MKTLVSIAVTVMVAFMAAPHFKNTTKKIPPIEHLQYDISTQQHELEQARLETDSLKMSIIKNQQYIRNVVPGAD